MDIPNLESDQIQKLFYYHLVMHERKKSRTTLIHVETNPKRMYIFHFNINKSNGGMVVSIIISQFGEH